MTIPTKTPSQRIEKLSEQLNSDVADFQLFQSLEERARILEEQGKKSGLKELLDQDTNDTTKLSLDWRLEIPQQIEQIDQLTWNLTIATGKFARAEAERLRSARPEISSEELSVQLAAALKNLKNPNNFPSLPDAEMQSAARFLQEGFGPKKNTPLGKFLQQEWPGFLEDLSPDLVFFVQNSAQVPESLVPIIPLEAKQPQESQGLSEKLQEKGKTLFQKIKEKPLLALLLAGTALWAITKMWGARKEKASGDFLFGAGILTTLGILVAIKFGDFEKFKELITEHWQKVKGFLGGTTIAAMIPPKWHQAIEEVRSKVENIEERASKLRESVSEKHDLLKTKWGEHRNQIVQNYPWLSTILPEDFDTILKWAGVTTIGGLGLGGILALAFAHQKTSIFGNILKLGKGVFGGGIARVALLTAVVGGLSAAFFLNKKEIQDFFQEFIEHHPEGKALWQEFTEKMNEAKEDISQMLDRSKQAWEICWRKIESAWGLFFKVSGVEANIPSWLKDPKLMWEKIKITAQEKTQELKQVPQKELLTEALIGIATVGILIPFVLKIPKLKPLVDVIKNPLTAKISAVALFSALMDRGELPEEAIALFFDAIRETRDGLLGFIPPEQYAQMDELVQKAGEDVSAFAVLMGLEGERHHFENPQEKKAFLEALQNLEKFIQGNKAIEVEDKKALLEYIHNITVPVSGKTATLFTSEFAALLLLLSQQENVSIMVQDHPQGFSLQVNNISFPPLSVNPYPFLSTAKEQSMEMGVSVVESLEILYRRLDGRTANLQVQKGITAANANISREALQRAIIYTGTLIELLKENGYHSYNDEAERELIRLLQDIPGMYIKPVGVKELEIGYEKASGGSEHYMRILKSGISFEEFNKERDYLDSTFVADLPLAAKKEFLENIELGLLEEILESAPQNSELYRKSLLLQQAVREHRDISGLAKEFWFAFVKNGGEIGIVNGVFTIGLDIAESSGKMMFVSPFSALGRELKELVCPDGDASFQRYVRESGIVPLSVTLGIAGAGVSILKIGKGQGLKAGFSRPFVWASTPARIWLKGSRIAQNPLLWGRMKGANMVNFGKNIWRAESIQNIYTYMRYQRELLYWSNASEDGGYLGSKLRIQTIGHAQEKVSKKLETAWRSSEKAQEAIKEFVRTRFGETSDIYRYITSTDVEISKFLEKLEKADELSQIIKAKDPKVLKSFGHALKIAGRAAVKTAGITRSGVRKIPELFRSVEIESGKAKVTYRQFGEMRRYDMEQLKTYLRDIGASEEGIEEAARIIKESKNLNQIVQVLEEVAKLPVGEWAKGLIRIGKFIPPAMAFAAAVSNAADAWQSFARAKEFERNPELKELLMNRGYVASGIGIGELTIDVLSASSYVASRYGVTALMTAGRVASKFALPLTVIFEGSRYIYNTVSETKEEQLMTADDYASLPREELFHRWYTTGFDNSFGEKISSFYRTSKREEYLEQRTVTRKKIITGLCKQEGIEPDSEKYKYRLRYLEIMGRTEFDMQSFQAAQEAFVQSGVFANIMANKTGTPLVYKNQPLHLSEARYDSDRIRMQEIVIIMKAIQDQERIELEKFLGVKQMARLGTLSDSYINFSINVILDALYQKKAHTSEDEKLGELVCHLTMYLNVERKKSLTRIEAISKDPKALEKIKKMYFNTDLEIQEKKIIEGGYRSLSPEGAAFFRLAEYFGYMGEANVVDLRKFFSADTGHLHGIYWNGEEWVVNKLHGFDKKCGKGGKETVAAICRSIREDPEDVLESRYEKVLDFRRRDDHDTRAAQALTLANILQQSFIAASGGLNTESWR